MKSKNYLSVISFIILAFTIYVSFNILMPSAEILKDVPANKFSTERALVHLKAISREPHFTGSNGQNTVIEYIVNELEKMGLQVEIQEQLAINKKWRAAAVTKNIITKIEGSENGKALLLLSHYDSNPHSSLGASDAGSGVVTILEGIRAYLTDGEKPKNDIIICITDAEELGLLGANAFVKYHPWASEVGLVLNFEARGSGGSSFMLLETNGGNKQLIEAFQQAKTPFPVANSLMYSLYKMLPNDTDLTVFREDKNISGYNFAFIDDHFDYHTAQDSYERLDINSLNHQASYLMAALPYFASVNLENLDSNSDYVYFNFPYIGLIYYPFSWVIPLFILSVFLFLAFFIIGFAARKLTVKGILKGFVPFILSLLGTSIVSFYGWKLLLKIYPQYRDILHGFTYNGYYYIAAFTALSIAICFWFYRGFFRKRSPQDLLIAPIFFWLIINGFIAFYLKGAAFFMLPLLLLLVYFSVLIFSTSRNRKLLFFTIIALPVLLIFAPLVKILPVGLGLKMLVISGIFTVFLFGVLIPVFQQYRSQKVFAALFFILALLMFGMASYFSVYSQDQKAPNSILYVYDTNKQEAYWASYNSNTDAFIRQFLGKSPTEGSFSKNAIASKYKTNIKLFSKAPVIPVEKPAVSVVLDTVSPQRKKVCLSVISHRNAHRIEVISNEKVLFYSFKVNGEMMDNKAGNHTLFSVNKGTVMVFYRTKPDEILDIEFEVDKNLDLNFDVVEARYDLFSNPHFDIAPRNKQMMPMPFVLNDATVTTTNIKF